MQATNFLLVDEFGTPLSFDAGEIRVVELEHNRQEGLRGRHHHVLHHRCRVHQLGQVWKGRIVRVHEICAH